MERTENGIKEQYEKYYKAADYVDRQKDLVKGQFKGSKMLDLGCGPVVHNVASASAYFSNILMADYVEDNCRALESWLNGQSTVKQFLDFPAELEGYVMNLEVGKKLLENRIRENVKQVVRCDVLKDHMFMESVKPEVSPPYDFIISSMCLQAASPDFDSFRLVLKRINKILRLGGGLILVGYLERENTWRLKQNVYHTLSLNEGDLRMALKESGFGNIEMRKQHLNLSFKHGSFYCLVAVKNVE